MEKEDNEQFILDAIQKLSWALLTGKYEVDEIHEIHQQSGIRLNEEEE